MCFQSDNTFIKKEFMGKMDINLYKKIIDESQSNGTKAITFGNLMDPESKVAKNALRDNTEKRDRQYEVLAELNYKPAITYLKKVNTREVGGHDSDSHGSHKQEQAHS